MSSATIAVIVVSSGSIVVASPSADAARRSESGCPRARRLIRSRSSSRTPSLAQQPERVLPCQIGEREALEQPPHLEGPCPHRPLPAREDHPNRVPQPRHERLPDPRIDRSEELVPVDSKDHARSEDDEPLDGGLGAVEARRRWRSTALARNPFVVGSIDPPLSRTQTAPAACASTAKSSSNADLPTPPTPWMNRISGASATRIRRRTARSASRPKRTISRSSIRWDGRIARPVWLSADLEDPVHRLRMQRADEDVVAGREAGQDVVVLARTELRRRKTRSATLGPDSSVKLCAPSGSLKSTWRVHVLFAGAARVVTENLASVIEILLAVPLAGALGSGLTRTGATVGESVGGGVGDGVAAAVLAGTRRAGHGQRTSTGGRNRCRCAGTDQQRAADQRRHREASKPRSHLGIPSARPRVVGHRREGVTLRARGDPRGTRR